MNPSDFIGVREAAAILGCTENTLRVRARRGKMTIARFGTGFHVLLRRDEVERLQLNPPKQGRPRRSSYRGRLVSPGGRADRVGDGGGRDTDGDRDRALRRKPDRNHGARPADRAHHQTKEPK